MTQSGFQSLTWVERLSDPAQPAPTIPPLGGFNPSPGLNVFQTPQHRRTAPQTVRFQSLTWVERLSDLTRYAAERGLEAVSIPHLG